MGRREVEDGLIVKISDYLLSEMFNHFFNAEVL